GWGGRSWVPAAWWASLLFRKNLGASAGAAVFGLSLLIDQCGRVTVKSILPYRKRFISTYLTPYPSMQGTQAPFYRIIRL
ncbi:MAG: hypothetical protein RR410_09255, partial [Alistipes sp.]